MSLEKKVDRIEEAILIMKDLMLRHEDRLDEFKDAIEIERKEREESRKDFDFKLNALIDAQIKNEIDIGNLKDASKSQLNRIENLENK
jgi:hypothetical protein